MGKQLEQEYGVWRLVISKVATLQEINQHYTYEDILKANSMLDMQEDIKSYYNEKVNKK